MNSQFNVVSTFSGCGGSSLGYQMAGGKILLAIEWNDHAVETYHLNFPDTDIYHGDIAKLSVNEVMQRTGLKPKELDILDGSPPCQGFSTAGKRCFIDERNQLYKEYVRLLQGLQPKVFVMENVSGMIKGKMRLIFRDILTELKNSGYDVKARLMNAMYYGVPQSRKRMIFIGIRNDLGIISSHPNPQTKPIKIKDVISDLNNIQNPEIDHIWKDESLTGNNSKGFQKASKVKQGQIYRFTHKRDIWDKPSPTLLTNGEKVDIPTSLSNSACHPIYTRTYSLLEYKRLSSFPDNFIFPEPKYKGWFRIGNSIPPLFMKTIAEHIRDNILNKINEVDHG